MYSQLFRKVLVHTDAEKIHHQTIKALKFVSHCAPLERLIAARFSNRSIHPVPQFGQEIFDRPVPSPIGLAAGLDKNAEAIIAFDSLGFGFIEVGTVTPRPQPGNEGKRLWRHPTIDAIRNRMGFNNDGAKNMGKRLKKLRSTVRGRQIIVGVNIGKNKNTTDENAAYDYAQAAREVARWADYLVINVSSPNTPRLRELQAVDALKPIVEMTKQAADETAGRDVPVFLKLAPDLEDSEISEICTFVNNSILRGVIATNTTVNHELGEGGLSGRPLTQRAATIVRQLRKELNADKKIIGVGGIWNEVDAERMIEAGADLFQVYTAFIFQGPKWLRRINDTLLKDEK
ncbi:quinone-dependent dihydroorotate dehydrogenase [Actinomycetaceae bacterium TAE3-ERU4]|nr:quinone-dependent dihydroorotate dehydrogenase [Actinomycetaceae bacterium TAE3-ERU4]